jgi:phage terminase small subunit
MKAKEYFNQFLNENQDKVIELRLVNAFRQMVLEVEQIAKMRSAESDTALVSIFKEIETKSHSFIRLVNETEPFKSEGTVKYDAFKLFVEQSSPSLAAVVWRS